MRVTKHTRGGVLGLDVRFEVDDEEARVGGSEPASLRLSPEQRERITRTAQQAAAVPEPVIAHDDAADVDGSTITLDIDTEAGHRTIELRAGDDAAEPVWELLDALEDLEQTARDAPR